MSGEQVTLWEAPRAAPRILRVTDLNRRVRSLLDGDPTLADVWVEGEVSQPAYPPSGHCFFTLKDAASQISDELKHQYRLGYDPPQGPQHFRRIEVRATRKGVVVRTRSGYMPPS